MKKIIEQLYLLINYIEKVCKMMYLIKMNTKSFCNDFTISLDETKKEVSLVKLNKELKYNVLVIIY